MTDFNYFNYFTEIEEYFWRKRGAHLLVSPLDWAIVETWQKSGIPLPAVLKGIDKAFESYSRSRRAAGGREMKSLAYCVDAVIDAATEAQEAAAGAGPSENGASHAKARPTSEGFSREELRNYFQRNAAKLDAAAKTSAAANSDLAARLEDSAKRITELAPIIDSPAALDLEDLERRLTILEEKLAATLHAAASEEALLDIRRELDRQLAPYRRKMSAAQLAQLEKQYIQKRLFELFKVPRLSLFYLT
jgi:hypothetical protein